MRKSQCFQSVSSLSLYSVGLQPLCVPTEKSFHDIINLCLHNISLQWTFQTVQSDPREWLD